MKKFKIVEKSTWKEQSGITFFINANWGIFENKRDGMEWKDLLIPRPDCEILLNTQVEDIGWNEIYEKDTFNITFQNTHDSPVDNIIWTVELIQWKFMIWVTTPIHENDICMPIYDIAKDRVKIT